MGAIDPIHRIAPVVSPVNTTHKVASSGDRQGHQAAHEQSDKLELHEEAPVEEGEEQEAETSLETALDIAV